MFPGNSESTAAGMRLARTEQKWLRCLSIPTPALESLSRPEGRLFDERR